MPTMREKRRRELQSLAGIISRIKNKTPQDIELLNELKEEIHKLKIPKSTK